MSYKGRKGPYSRVRKARGKNKNWVFLDILSSYNSRAISFEELYYICQWIGECEDEKYPKDWHEGRQKLIRFLMAAIDNTATYEELAILHKLDPPKMNDIRQAKLL